MKPPTLNIAPELPLPFETVTRALALVAQRGSGKTYCARVLCEEMVKNGLPVAIIDPLGVLYGLALTPDGQSPALPIAVLGGAHGHIPLTPENGRAVASFLIESPRPIVIDLSEFRKAGQREFVTAFAEELYHRNRVPLHLIVDEADLFIPQRPQKGEERMLGAFEDVVRRGRVRGLGITMITQRPAVLHKDVLTQADALVMLRLSGPQDRKAVEAWINVQADPGKAAMVLQSLPSLPVGTAWFWSPGWLNVLRKIKVRQAETFDSSKTPKVGEVVAEPKPLAPVDLEALRGLLMPGRAAPKAKIKEKLGAKRVERHLGGPDPLRVIHPTSKFPEGAEVALTKLTERVNELSRAVERLSKTAEAFEEPPYAPSKIEPVEIVPPSHVTHTGFTEMEEELYQKFKKRLILELRETPELIRLAIAAPLVEVHKENKLVELDTSTIRGAIENTVGVRFLPGFKNE